MEVLLQILKAFDETEGFLLKVLITSVNFADDSLVLPFRFQ